MSRGQRVDLSEGLEVVHGELVAEQVEEDVVKGASDRVGYRRKSG